MLISPVIDLNVCAFDLQIIMRDRMRRYYMMGGRPHGWAYKVKFDCFVVMRFVILYWIMMLWGIIQYSGFWRMWWAKALLNIEKRKARTLFCKRSNFSFNHLLKFFSFMYWFIDGFFFQFLFIHSTIENFS